MGPQNKSKNNRSVGISGSIKESSRKRRQVSKPILDNPYTQSNLWPFVEPSIAQSILDLLGILLSSIGHYNSIANARSSDNGDSLKPRKPYMCNKITVGFNSTMGVLEKQAKQIRTGKADLLSQRKTEAISEQQENLEDDYFKYVFVTRYDITPLLLTSHFPVLSITSSKSASDRVKLVQLPRGSMEKLSSILCSKDVGIIALTSNIDKAEPLYDLIDSTIDNVHAPWLENFFANSERELSSVHFKRPPVKLLSTSSPLPSKARSKQNKGSTKKR